MKVCLALLLAAVLTMSYVVKADANSQGLDALASHIAGTQVTVDCYPSDDADEFAGFVFADSYDGGVSWVMDTVIHLRGQDCGALENVLHGEQRWLRTWDGQQDAGYALFHLAHEAVHIATQSTDEGLVECVTYRNTYNYAKYLPVVWKDRQNIYRAAERTHYGVSDPEYRSVC